MVSPHLCNSVLFLKECLWSNSYFHELLFFRICTWYTNPSFGNQWFRTRYTKSMVFVWNQTIRTAFTWAIIRNYFIWFAKKTGGSFTIWKRTFCTGLTLTSNIDNIIKRWTMFAFSATRSLRVMQWFFEIVRFLDKLWF